MAMIRSLDKALVAIVLLVSVTLSYVGGFLAAYTLIFAVLAMALLLLAERKWPWLPDDRTAQLFAAAFVLLGVAFSITMRQPGDLLRLLNFVMFLMFAPLSATLARAASPRNGLVVAIPATLGCILAFAVALYQAQTMDTHRVTGFGSDPIWSIQAGIIVGFLALLGVVASQKWWRWLFLIGPLMMIAVAILAGSRGPLLAIPVLAVIFVIGSSRRWWLSLALVVLAGAACLTVAVWLWPTNITRLMSVGKVVSDLATSGTIAEASAGQRQWMYRAGIAAFLDSPWVGYGWSQLMTAILPYMNETQGALMAPHRHLHSDSLDFAVGAGGLGLLAYGLVLAAPIIGVLGSVRDSLWRFRMMAATGLSIGYAIFGVSYLTFGYEYHTTLYVCFAGLIVSFCRDAPPHGADQHRQPIKPEQADGK